MIFNRKTAVPCILLGVELRWFFGGRRRRLILAHRSLETMDRLSKPFPKLRKLSRPIDHEHDGENQQEFDPSEGSKHEPLAFGPLSVPKVTAP